MFTFRYIIKSFFQPSFLPGFLFLWLVLSPAGSFSQQGAVTDSSYKVVIAGKQYATSPAHQKRWGKHYRKEWNTPVKVKVVLLDTLAGGLTPYQEGGGRQSKTLRLRDKNNKEYVLRSVDKSFGKALPEIAQGTFIEKIVNDQASIGHPYAALTLPPMLENTGIYHTYPRIIFIPRQPRLEKYNEEYGDRLYLFEQRPDENWEEADNFGNSGKIIGTEKLQEKIFEDYSNRVDQLAFVRARLFDFLVGDWSRHEDQWRWAEKEFNDRKIYYPIPRDRDQVYTQFDGWLLSLLISVAGLDHLQSFDYSIRDITTFNFPARHIDRWLLNEPSRDQWIQIARELQQQLTDSLIEIAIKHLPPEVYPISGPEIAAKIKSRRDHLDSYALDYYSFLAREVDITGSRQQEYFEITGASEFETEIKIYGIKESGDRELVPFYKRKFFENETREIRLYGMEGKDRFVINNMSGNEIKIRLIGGPGADEYRTLQPAKKIHVYDDNANSFLSSSLEKHLSTDTSVHSYQYESFEYDSKGIKPSLYYSTEDHFYTGIKYQATKHQWRKSPFGYEQTLGLRYSISERAFSTEYMGTFTRFIGNWDLVLNTGYDFIRWNNFYGTGNDSKMMVPQRNYHRVRSRELWGSAGLARTVAKNHHLGVSATYRRVKILEDKNRYFDAHYPKPKNYNPIHTGIVSMDYTFTKVDDRMLPSKGMVLASSVSYNRNLKQGDSTVVNYSAMAHFYLPLSRSLILSVKTGGAALSGKPEFFQLNKLGGGKTLRGYRRYRFYGHQMLYNQNELQFVKNIKSYLYKGKGGLLVFYDIGRVWLPGEKSDTWHTGYGGGIILSPFNKITIMAGYGFSRHENAFHILLRKSF